MKWRSRNIGLHAAMFAVTGAVLAACGVGDNAGNADGTANAAQTATAFTNQTVLTNAEYLAKSRYADADVNLGERLALQCRACHTLETGGAQLLGPNLGSLFGRPVAVLPDFGYSQVLAAADFVWTPDALDAWLANPGRFLPGNRMVFAGIRDKTDRDALIAYLLQATATEPSSDPGAGGPG
jgi:cytochrome c